MDSSSWLATRPGGSLQFSLLGVLLLVISAGIGSAQASEADISNLPLEALRTRMEGLPAPARARALDIIKANRIPAEDHVSLRVDNAGGVYYVCTAPPAAAAPPAPAAAGPVVQGAAVPISSQPIYHSKSGATRAIFLDFNGHTATSTAWGSLVARPYDLDGNETTFNDAEQSAIQRIWARVAEDYASFDVDVTTEEQNSLGNNQGRVVFTRDTDANGVAMPSKGAGGVAYVGVFGDSNYAATFSPAWVYFNNLGGGRDDYCAEAASHEMGHNMGLSHDGLTNGAAYYGGHGSGATSWGPIMGTGYDRNVSQWSKGGYYLANNIQDDFAIIAGHCPYRSDDYGNTDATATYLAPAGGTAVSITGIIANAADIDVVAIPCGSGSVSLSVAPFVAPGNTRGGNLDVRLELYDANGILVASADPTSTTSATLAIAVVQGGYFLRILPTGVGTPLSNAPDGYTVYGSAGQYTLSGTVVASTGDVFAPNASLATGGNVTSAGGTSKSFTVT